MPELTECMKQLAAGVFEAKKPVELRFGTVQSREPFRVRLEQKTLLTKEFFIVRQGVTVRSFETGDVLLLLRVQGGQKYLILDKRGTL